MTAPYVVGLDISLTGTGIAGLGWSNAVESTGKKDDTWRQRHDRIQRMYVEIWDVIGSQPDLLVVETPAYSRVGGSNHDRSGLWWSIIANCLDAETPVAFVAPTGRALYATGKGGAGKSAVVEQVARRFGDVWTDLGGNDNRADAVVLCAMGLDYLGHPAAKVPANHRRALDAVRWPELPALVGGAS